MEHTTLDEILEQVDAIINNISLIEEQSPGEFATAKEIAQQLLEELESLQD